ncbi:methanethiol S-methyltransferase [Mycobacterium kansasii]|uniref:methanethiol S-methyltransferase n=1 Tax=Mycobacterium kansasii TaxID=1768 RepID=UPI000C070CA5|nr:methanethiol S-methyltransferase [Mycobacterium kansasii]
MRRVLVVGYGAICYLIFVAAFLYAIGFVGNLLVPRTVDNGITASTSEAVVVDIVLLGLFAVQHSVMARPWFKSRWTRVVPATVERSTYVLLSSLLLLLLFWQWRAMPAVIWAVSWPPAKLLVQGLFWLGWVIAFTSTFMINHFDLFGLRQVYLAARERTYTHLEFRSTMLYRLVRHPIMLGFIVAFWATPTMPAGHLLFAVMTTGYILVALPLEEHDLSRSLGDDYRRYRNRVPMLIPGLLLRKQRRRPGTATR